MPSIFKTFLFSLVLLLLLSIQSDVEAQVVSVHTATLPGPSNDSGNRTHVRDVELANGSKVVTTRSSDGSSTYAKVDASGNLVYKEYGPSDDRGGGGGGGGPRIYVGFPDIYAKKIYLKPENNPNKFFNSSRESLDEGTYQPKVMVANRGCLPTNYKPKSVINNCKNDKKVYKNVSGKGSNGSFPVLLRIDLHSDGSWDYEEVVNNVGPTVPGRTNTVTFPSINLSEGNHQFEVNVDPVIERNFTSPKRPSVLTPWRSFFGQPTESSLQPTTATESWQASAGSSYRQPTESSLQPTSETSSWLTRWSSFFGQPTVQTPQPTTARPSSQTSTASSSEESTEPTTATTSPQTSTSTASSSEESAEPAPQPTSETSSWLTRWSSFFGQPTEPAPQPTDEELTSTIDMASCGTTTGCINEGGEEKNLLTKDIEIYKPRIYLGSYLIQDQMYPELEEKLNPHFLRGYVYRTSLFRSYRIDSPYPVIGSESFNNRNLKDGDEYGLFWLGTAVDYESCRGQTETQSDMKNDFSGGLIKWSTKSAPFAFYDLDFVSRYQQEVSTYWRNTGMYDINLDRPEENTWHRYTITCESASTRTPVTDTLTVCNGSCEDLPIEEIEELPIEPVEETPPEEVPGEIAEEAPPALGPDISASKNIVRQGDDIDILWELNGGSDCSLSSNLSSNPSEVDSETVVLNSISTFTISCSNGSDSVTVFVLPRLQET